MIQYSTEQVLLIQVPGSWISCQSVHPSPHANNENSISTLESIKPKRISPNNSFLCIIPSIPSVSPFVDPDILEKALNHIEVSAPLKGDKSPYSDKKAFGYRSGRRSSIIPCRTIKKGESISPSDWVIATDEAKCIKYVADFTNRTTLLRAKGCGMWLKDSQIPFPSFSMKKSDSKYAPTGKTVLEISGVSYYKTSLHEMYSTTQIEANLNKIGLFCANHPIGFWIYRNVEGDSSPLFDKTVSIFETYGDTRLEAHLLTGLERLLVKKYDDSFASKIIESITPLFEGMDDKIPNKNCPSFCKCYHISPEAFKQKLSDGSFFNLDDFDLNELNDDCLRKEGLIPSIQIYEILNKIDRSFSNLAKLFGQIGFECGRCLSAIHRSGFIWGYFEDNTNETFQCNSHCNNLIVLSKEQCLSNKKRFQILAPLDFDMCFNKDSTVDLNSQPPTPNPLYFYDNFFTEFNILLNDVGGFCGTFNAITAIKARPKPPGLLYDILWLLRDCATYEFLQGYQKVNLDRCNGNDISVDEIYDLIYEGLSESINENARPF